MMKSLFNRAEEELTAVCVRPRIGHGERALPHVLELEVLVWEITTVDALTSNPNPMCEVTTLNEPHQRISLILFRTLRGE